MAVFISMLVFIAIMFLGYGLEKKGFFSNSADKDFSKLITNIALPAMVLASLESSDKVENREEVLSYLFILFLMYALFVAIALIFPKLVPIKKGSMGTAQFLLIFNNNGFMGIPLALALYGEIGAFYVALTLIPFNILMYSVGIMLMSGDGKYDDGQLNFKVSKILKQAGFLASLIMFIIFIFAWSLPEIIQDGLSLVGGIATPLSMLVIGMTMAKVDIVDAFKDKRVYILMLVKMILLPLAVYFIFKPFLANELMLNAMIIVAAMPGPAVATSFSLTYGGDRELASSYIFVSTLAAAIIVPMLMSIL